VFSRDELKQKDMVRRYPKAEYVIGDVTDTFDVSDVILENEPLDFVIHTAAMKHVDLCEKNAAHCARVNIQGTANVVQSCDHIGGEKGGHKYKCILVSSDKSIDPISAYGASKLMAEKIWKEANNPYRICSIVRSGNMYGSRGSIIPKWQEEAAAGRPLQITDPDMKRYWIKPAHLARFIISCFDIMQGGETFVPNCDYIPLIDIAERINKENNNQAGIKILGLRPGEKLEEKLIGDHEKAEEKEWGWLIR
jgi:UDP-N-acetylglucosamine 4,6-dehydratase